MKNIFLIILGVTLLISASTDPMSTVNQFTVNYSDSILNILNGITLLNQTVSDITGDAALASQNPTLIALLETWKKGNALRHQRFDTLNCAK
jgi:hypothetical protein